MTFRAPDSSVALAFSPGNARPEIRYRILCIGETWLGSDARAAFMALRRLGHSIRVLDESTFVPIQWRSTRARALRKIFRPLLVRELMREARRVIPHVKPHCLFVFKGAFVHPEIIRAYREQGIPTANYYPDITYTAYGPELPAALPLYDRVFTTKSFGVRDMKDRLGADNATFLEHGYDPEIHRPIALTLSERRLYGCDVVFAGSWSREKEATLAALRRARPSLHLRIWGSRWELATSPELRDCVQGDEVLGDEYAKALQGGKIALALLTGQLPGASSGDLTTMRTFQIPACGAFMLHVRTDEATSLYEDGKEAAFFSSNEELARLVDYYLAHDEERLAVAQRGRARACPAYSVDARLSVILEWLGKQQLPEW